jgi:type I restriction enzyme S subunit
MKWTDLPEFENCPAGWEVVPLNQIADFIAGQSPDSAFYNTRGEGLPFLQGNAEFGPINPHPTIYCTAPTKVCNPGDTLISVRAPVGALNRADRAYGLGRGVGGLLPKDVSPEYLYQAMTRWRLPLRRAAQGSTFDAVTARHFRQLRCCLPSDPVEQEAIAKWLNMADQTIAVTETKLTAAWRLKTALMQQLFTRGVPGRHRRFRQTKIGEIPECWELNTLAEHCGGPNCVKTGPFGAQLPEDVYANAGVPMANITDIGEGDLHLTSGFFVREEVFERLRDNALIEGDVVFSRVASVGRLALILKEHEPLLMSSNCIRLRPGNAFNSKFLTHVFHDAESVGRQVEAMSNAGARPLVTPRFLRRMLIPRPPREEQDEIARLIESTEAVVSGVKGEIAALQRLKRSLLQNLLTGRVRVCLEAHAAAD